MEKIDERIYNIEKKISGGWRFWLPILSPLIVAVFGAYFTYSVEQAKHKLQQVEVEVKKTDAAQKMLTELFSEKPERGFIADRLMSKLVDKELSKEIHAIVESYYSERIEKLSRESPDQARKLRAVAAAIGGSAAKNLLEKEYHIVVKSIPADDKEAAISEAKALAQKLKAKGYGSEAHYSSSGWYVVTIGHFLYPDAESRKRKAIGNKDIDEGSYLTDGHTFTEKIFPR